MKKHIQKILQKVKNNYLYEISLAKANSYDGVILPVDSECDIHSISDIDDIDYIYEITSESGWDRFIIIDFINGSDKLIYLDEFEAA